MSEFKLHQASNYLAPVAGPREMQQQPGCSRVSLDLVFTRSSLPQLHCLSEEENNKTTYNIIG